jgi:hypothetical protein
VPNLGRREPYPPIGPAHDPLSLYRQMKDFLLWLEEKNTSSHTLEHWELYLRYFVQWCDERGLTRPAEITRPIIERYQRHLRRCRPRRRPRASRRCASGSGGSRAITGFCTTRPLIWTFLKSKTVCPSTC